MLPCSKLGLFLLLNGIAICAHSRDRLLTKLTYELGLFVADLFA